MKRMWQQLLNQWSHAEFVVFTYHTCIEQKENIVLLAGIDEELCFVFMLTPVWGRQMPMLVAEYFRRMDVFVCIWECVT